VIGFSNEYETGSCGMYPFAEPDDYSSCSALGPPSAGHVGNPSYYCDDYAGAFTWDDYDLARTDYISLDFQKVVGLWSSTATLLILEQNSFGWVGKVEVSHEKDSTSFPTTVFDTSTGSQDGTSCSSPGHTPGSSNILEIPIEISAGQGIAGVKISTTNPQTSGSWMEIEAVGICLPPFPLCACDNFRNGLTTDHLGEEACARTETHGLSGPETWCAIPSRTYLPFQDEGCNSDSFRCIVSHAPPTFPVCACDVYENGASESNVDGLCVKRQDGVGRVCRKRNYMGDKKIGGSEFYGCPEDMIRCSTSAMASA